MMATSSESVEATVLAALQVLYQQHLQPDQVQGADAYLRAFQVTPEAFHVAVALLDRFFLQVQQHPDQLQATIPVLFFASQTLANKLRRHHALPTDGQFSFAAWSEKIVRWLAAMPPAMPKMIPTQLILALMACLPRVSTQEIAMAYQSGKVQRLVVNGTAANGGGDTVVGYVLNMLSAAGASPTILAEVLIMMAEEWSDVQDRSIRDRMQRELDDWAVTVLDVLLPQLMQDVTTQDLVLQGVCAWIRYARVSSAVVANNALMQSIVAFLRHDELFDVAVDLVVELVRCYTDLQRDLPLIQWLVPQILQLKGDFAEAARDEDREKCFGLCRIFTELGESYMELLIGDQQMGQTMIVDLLLDCMSYPDAEIADVTTSFWFTFLARIDKVDPRRGAQSAVATPFQGQIIRLASICMKNLQFSGDFPKLPSDKRQDFKSFRQSLGDILRDCCDAVGVDSIMKHCVEGLQSIFQLPEDQRRWEAVEAHLYCVRSIGRNVERADPRVTSPSLQIIFQHLPRFAIHPSIKYTACLIISRYGLWLRENKTYLTPLVEFLHTCIVTSTQDTAATEWQVASAAAMALRTIAIDCWSTLGSEVLRFYVYVEQNNAMAIEDQVLILEGICTGVVNSGDISAVYGVLEQAAEPIVQRLSAVFAASASGQQVNSTTAMNEMLRMICFYDYLTIDDPDMLKRDSDKPPLLLLTERVWASFDQMLALFRASDELVERVCRCYKRMLRTCGPDFKPFVPNMVKNLLSFYQSEPKSSYLYAGSMVLKHFHHDRTPEIQNLLVQMLHTFAKATLPLFKNLETMRSHPDIIEEFFYLMERGLRTLPNSMVQSPDGKPTAQGDELLAQILVCSVSALQISHNDANKGTLSFLEQVVERSVQNGTPDLIGSQLHRIVQDGFLTGGVLSLIDSLLRGVVLGTIPRYRVDEDFGSVAGVLVQLAKVNGAALQQGVSNWFTQAQTANMVPFLTSQEIRVFQDDMFTATNEREFRRVVRHFARTCSSRTEATVLDSER